MNPLTSLLYENSKLEDRAKETEQLVNEFNKDVEYFKSKYTLYKGRDNLIAEMYAFKKNINKLYGDAK